MPFDRLRESRYRGKAAVTGPPVPFVQEIAGPTTVAAVDVLQGQLDPPGTGNLEVCLRSRQAVERLRLGLREVFGVAEPDEARFLQAPVFHLLHAADLVESLVHELHHVELVKGDPGLGEVLLDPAQ